MSALGEVSHIRCLFGREKLLGCKKRYFRRLVISSTVQIHAKHHLDKHIAQHGAKWRLAVRNAQSRISDLIVNAIGKRAPMINTTMLTAITSLITCESEGSSSGECGEAIIVRFEFIASYVDLGVSMLGMHRRVLTAVGRDSSCRVLAESCRISDISKEIDMRSRSCSAPPADG
jgi:hypothetical protein